MPAYTGILDLIGEFVERARTRSWSLMVRSAGHRPVPPRRLRSPR